MLKLIKGNARDKTDEAVETPPVEARPPESALSAELSSALGQLLVPHLGPVANHVVRSHAATCDTLEELVLALSDRIPDARERSVFLHAARTSSISSLPFRNDDSVPDPLALAKDKGQAGPQADATEEKGELFTPEQLNRLTQTLAYYVGPLASRLVKAHKGKVSSIEELNNAVAKAISDPDDWAEFLMRRRKDT